jgi:hypothetical protein
MHPSDFGGRSDENWTRNLWFSQVPEILGILVEKFRNVRLWKESYLYACDISPLSSKLPYGKVMGRLGIGWPS